MEVLSLSAAPRTLVGFTIKVHSAGKPCFGRDSQARIHTYAYLYWPAAWRDDRSDISLHCPFSFETMQSQSKVLSLCGLAQSRQSQRSQ
jgi:hypothetical protein